LINPARFLDQKQIGIISARLLVPPAALSSFTKVVVLPFIGTLSTLCGVAQMDPSGIGQSSPNRVRRPEILVATRTHAQAADALLRAVGRSARHPAAMAGLARARQTKLIFMMLPLRLSPRKRANVMEYRGEPFAVLNSILASSPKRPDRAHRGCERQGSENYSLTSP